LSIVAQGLREVEPAEWDALLEGLGCGDAYLKRGYVEASSLLDPGRAAFLHLGDERGDVVFPCLLRDVPEGEGVRDVTTPYGFGGPAAAGREPPVERFWALYESWCAENGVVTTFIRFHPLLGNHRHSPPGAPLERLADCAVWPLEGDEDALFARMHRSHRNKCRKARGAGLDVVVEAGPERLDDFARLHEETMRRHDASAFYFFPPEYWERLAGDLGEGLVRLDARLDGELVASELCLAGDRWLHYHMGITSEAARSLGAANLLVFEAARYGLKRGLAALNLGNGLGGREDSLWEFKQRFSDEPGREDWVAKLVHDEEAYRRLSGGSRGGDGYFPAYRAPR
jgi:serine/alanine adding enzyme